MYGHADYEYQFCWKRLVVICLLCLSRTVAENLSHLHTVTAWVGLFTH